MVTFIFDIVFIFEVVFIFKVVFTFEVVFLIYSMSRSNLLFTASKSDLKHLRRKFWVWHCSAKLKHLSAARLSRSLKLLGSMSWISSMSKPLPESRALTIGYLKKWIQNVRKKENKHKVLVNALGLNVLHIFLHFLKF